MILTNVSNDKYNSNSNKNSNTNSIYHVILVISSSDVQHLLPSTDGDAADAASRTSLLRPQGRRLRPAAQAGDLARLYFRHQSLRRRTASHPRRLAQGEGFFDIRPSLVVNISFCDALWFRTAVNWADHSSVCSHRSLFRLLHTARALIRSPAPLTH